MAFKPAPDIKMSPRLMLKEDSAPSRPITGTPVVRVMRSVLMKPQPAQVMP